MHSPTISAFVTEASQKFTWGPNKGNPGSDRRNRTELVQRHTLPRKKKKGVAPTDAKHHRQPCGACPLHKRTQTAQAKTLTLPPVPTAVAAATPEAPRSLSALLAAASTSSHSDAIHTPWLTFERTEDRTGQQKHTKRKGGPRMRTTEGMEAVRG